MTTDSRSISQDTQAVLLLCGRFSSKEDSKQLTLGEYNGLAAWLGQSGASPAALLEHSRLDEIDWLAAKLDRDRAVALLERGAALALAVEKWSHMGIWILSRGDDDYPSRLRDHLGRNAPALLYGAGSASLANCGGLAIVGSRDVDEEGETFTAAVGQACAEQRVTVVSGGARGVDQIAIGSGINAGGTAIAVLPEGLGKESLASKYREGLREERLTLISPFSPEAGFSVGNAMGRNKLIYALADAALVVSTSLRKGGTWAGADEELKRERSRPVYVRLDGKVPEGNEALERRGAWRFPSAPWDLASLLHSRVESQMTIADGPAVGMTPKETEELVPPPEVERVQSEGSSRPPRGTEEPRNREFEAPGSVYEAMLPRLLAAIERPKESNELAEELDLPPSQLKAWLERGVKEGWIEKKKKPVRYVRARGSESQTAFGFEE